MTHLSVQSLDVMGPANTQVFAVNNNGVVSESGLTLKTNGLTVTDGGVTVTKGGLTVSADTTSLLGHVVRVSVAATVPTPTGAAQTIATDEVINAVNPAGACTGAILAAGSQNGQLCIVINQSQDIAKSITFDAAPATSNVWNDGTNAQVILAGTGKMFVWDTTLAAWVALAPFGG